MKDWKQQFETFCREEDMTFLTRGIQRRLHPFFDLLLEEARKEGLAEGKKEGREEMKKECIEKLKQREKKLLKERRNYDVKQVQYDIKSIGSL